jgi:hypothetical protein
VSYLVINKNQILASSSSSDSKNDQKSQLKKSVSIEKVPPNPQLKKVISTEKGAF